MLNIKFYCQQNKKKRTNSKKNIKHSEWLTIITRTATVAITTTTTATTTRDESRNRL